MQSQQQQTNSRVGTRKRKHRHCSPPTPREIAIAALAVAGVLITTPVGNANGGGDSDDEVVPTHTVGPAPGAKPITFITAVSVRATQLNVVPSAISEWTARELGKQQLDTPQSVVTQVMRQAPHLRAMMDELRKQWCDNKSAPAFPGIDDINGETALERLKCNGWLSSSIIGHIFESLQKTHSTCAFVSSYFVADDTPVDVLAERLQRYANRGVITANAPTIFFVLNTRQMTHWALVVVCPLTRRARYYDSLAASDEPEDCDSVLHRQARMQLLCEAVGGGEWDTRLAGDAPLQRGSNNCGVFVCMNALSIVRAGAPAFRQEHCTVFRYYIAQQLRALGQGV